MKKRTLLLLFLCAISVPFLWEEGPSQQVGTKATGIAFLLPKADSEFSDLDVRDAQNNVAQAPSARQELETLFRENLVNLTVFISPHVFTEALTWIDSFSHLFNKLIIMRLYVILGLFQDAFLPPSRRFVHNVHNLCITFSVGVFACSLMLSAFALQRSSLRVHLRC